MVKMINGSRCYTALESVSIASALSTALTIYPCQIPVHVVCFFWVFLCIVFPSVHWYCLLGLLTCKTVSAITYTVFVDTLNTAQSSPVQNRKKTTLYMEVNNFIYISAPRHFLMDISIGMLVICLVSKPNLFCGYKVSSGRKSPMFISWDITPETVSSSPIRSRTHHFDRSRDVSDV